MKIIINSNDNFILFFNKLNNISLNDDYEEEFKKIFLKLKKYYNIDIYGFYNVEAYIDNYYGTILKVIKDDDFDLYYKQIDMHITIEKCNFLYRVRDYFFVKNIKNFNIYFYKNSFYLEIINELNNKDMIYLIENSEIIYENIDRIKNYKVKINS